MSKPKHDYTALDAAILSELTADKPKPFVQLCSSRSAANMAANKLTGPEWHSNPSWVFIDRRLQALRKAGRIRYQRKPEGWLLTDPVLAGRTKE